MRDSTNIFVTRPYMPPRAEFDAYVDKIWDTRWLTNNGPLLAEFESKLRNYLGVSKLELTVDGHAALELALKEGCGVSGEVITTPFTFASTVHAIKRSGARPVFADVKDSDMTIDPASIERCISDKTTAIVPVHVYGHVCDIDAIQSLANKHGLKVVYDAAHAFGERVGEQSVLTAGDFSILSFHATKLFNSCEGGAVVYTDPSAGHSIRTGKNFGILSEEVVESPGGNSKMNELQAAMGLAILPHMPEILADRRKIAERYRTHLGECQKLRLFYPDKSPATTYNYGYFPVLITPEAANSRDEVYSKLKQQGIYTRRYFWPLASDFECYAECRRDVLTVARSVSEQVLCLPMYADLSLDDVDRVCRLLLPLL